MATKINLGARRSAVGMFTAGYSVTTTQQLLKGKDGIVMKRSLYHLINNLQANYHVLIIHNNKRPYYYFSFPNCSLEVFFQAQAHAH